MQKRGEKEGGIKTEKVRYFKIPLSMVLNMELDSSILNYVTPKM